jgi:hypothetical protein
MLLTEAVPHAASTETLPAGPTSVWTAGGRVW